MASKLMCLTPEQVVQIFAFIGDIVLCSWLDTELSQCLSPIRCINEYPRIKCDVLASYPWDSRNTRGRFAVQKPKLNGKSYEPIVFFAAKEKRVSDIRWIRGPFINTCVTELI